MIGGQGGRESDVFFESLPTAWTLARNQGWAARPAGPGPAGCILFVLQGFQAQILLQESVWALESHPRAWSQGAYLPSDLG